ncbi:MAG: phage holin family protein [Chthoniobacterales bacterium]
MSAFFIRWVITTVAVMCAAAVLGGIDFDGSVGVLLGASLLLGIANALVRPVLLLLSLPFIIVTMGLFIFVVNAVLLLIVSSVVPGFQVDGFWSAFFGSIIISLVSWALSSFFRTSDGKVHLITHHERVRRSPTIKQADARVVDE